MALTTSENKVAMPCTLSCDTWNSTPLFFQSRYTGFLRRVEVEKIRQQHNNRDICLLTTLGVSPSGEVFNVNSECLAAGVAGALGASKIIYFTERDMELRHKARHQRIQSLRVSDASALLDFYGVKCDKRGFTTLDERATDRCSRSMLEMLFRIGWGTRALTLGVKRAHIISPRAGAVLQELYTRDGNGILVAADIYEGMRRASVQEVAEVSQEELQKQLRPTQFILLNYENSSHLHSLSPDLRACKATC